MGPEGTVGSGAFTHHVVRLRLVGGVHIQIQSLVRNLGVDASAFERLQGCFGREQVHLEELLVCDVVSVVVVRFSLVPKELGHIDQRRDRARAWRSGRLK